MKMTTVEPEVTADIFFVMPPLVSCKMTSEKGAQKFDTEVQIGVVLLTPMQHDQSEALPRSGSDMHQFGIPALVY